MTSENNSNPLSKNVRRILDVLTSNGIEVRDVFPIDSLSYRIEFLLDETLFVLHISEKIVEIITYLGGLSADDSRLPALKEASNLTNFRLVCDHVLWSAPDKENYIWFLSKRVVTIDKVETGRLNSTISFALEAKKTWRSICQSLLGPNHSDLGARLN